MGVRAGASVFGRPILALDRGYELGRGLEATAIARAGLSKIDYYLVDNVSSIRLSELNRGVNDKAFVRSEGARIISDSITPDVR
jgi:hypothetical protein